MLRLLSPQYIFLWIALLICSSGSCFSVAMPSKKKEIHNAYPTLPIPTLPPLTIPTLGPPPPLTLAPGAHNNIPPDCRMVRKCHRVDGFRRCWNERVCTSGGSSSDSSGGSSDSDGSGSGDIIGIVFGVLAGCAILFGALYYCCSRYVLVADDGAEQAAVTSSSRLQSDDINASGRGSGYGSTRTTDTTDLCLWCDRNPPISGIKVCDPCSRGIAKDLAKLAADSAGDALYFSASPGEALFQLSNSYECEQVYDTRVYMTAESLFQSGKFLSTAPGVAERIRTNPSDAQAIATRASSQCRRDWPKFRDSFLLAILRNKFRNVHLRRVLLATRDAKLVLRSADDYLGEGEDGSGQNMLGITLMQIRDEIRNEE